MVLEGKEEKLLTGSFKYKRFGDQVYIFDKVIFRLTFVAVLIVFFFVAIDTGGFSNHFFYSCPANNGAPCQNPFWEGCSKNAFYTCSDINLIPEEYSFLGDKEFISAGEIIGERPGFLVNYFGLLFFLLLLNAFLFNHYTYNRGFIFKELKKEINRG